VIAQKLLNICKLCRNHGTMYDTTEYPEAAEFVNGNNDNDESNTSTTMDKANEDRNVYFV